MQRILFLLLVAAFCNPTFAGPKRQLFIPGDGIIPGNNGQITIPLSKHLDTYPIVNLFCQIHNAGHKKNVIRSSFGKHKQLSLDTHPGVTKLIRVIYLYENNIYQAPESFVVENLGSTELKIINCTLEKAMS